MKVRYRARALNDLEEIYRYLEPRNPAGAANVLRTIHEAIGQIANPTTGIRVTVERKLRSRFTANGILKEADLPKAF